MPCAGIGSRAGTPCPKQYAPLAGRALVAHTLAALAAVPRLHATLVVLAADDTGFEAAAPGFGSERGWVVGRARRRRHARGQRRRRAGRAAEARRDR